MDGWVIRVWLGELLGRVCDAEAHEQDNVTTSSAPLEVGWLKDTALISSIGLLFS